MSRFFENRIKEKRENAGLTQKQLSMLIGVDESLISKEIKQRVSMAIETLLATMRKACYGNLCKTKFRIRITDCFMRNICSICACERMNVRKRWQFIGLINDPGRLLYSQELWMYIHSR